MFRRSRECPCRCIVEIIAASDEAKLQRIVPCNRITARPIADFHKAVPRTPMINPVGIPLDMENGEEQIPHMDLNDEAKHLLFYLRLEDSIKDTLATVGEVLSLGRPGRRHRPKTASTSP